MHRRGSQLILSATDLANFLGCRHRTALDMEAVDGPKRASEPSPLLEILWQRGLDHEKRYVDSLRTDGRRVEDLSGVDRGVRAAKTIEAMRAGADVIVQGELRDGYWLGYPDVMRRVETPSDFGDWSYEIDDTKLARETKAGTILQLGLYSEMLAIAQGARPRSFYVVTPDPVTPMHTYRVNDYAAYFRLVRNQMVGVVALDHGRVAAENYPDPVAHCDICRWLWKCAKKRRADDHLSLVAGITRIQRRELQRHSITTLTALAGLPIPIEFKPRRGSPETYERVREQARLQLESRDRIPPLHQLLPIDPTMGLCRLPEPTPGDLFLDLEGDAFVGDGGREYLFGIATSDGEYRSAWAFTEADEQRAFEWVIDMIVDAARAHPGMHVYHYAPYETTAFKRLMGKYVTRENELDAMLRGERFVDLYAVVRQGLRAGIERYSIKNLEPLYEFERTVALPDASKSLRAMELGLESGMPDAVPDETRNLVEGYNRDDCVSTWRLRDWLESLRAGVVATGTEVPRPLGKDGVASEDLDAKAQIVAELRKRLLAGIPGERIARDNEQQGRWLLAYMLDYHRREDKATWWEYYRLLALPEQELLDEREAVAGLVFEARVHEVLNKKTGRPTGSVIDRYRYPEQEMEIDRGAEVRLQDKKPIGKVESVDRVKRTIDVCKGPSRAASHPSAMFEFQYVPCDAAEKSLLRIGESVANGAEGFGAARALLARTPPRLTSSVFGSIEGVRGVSAAVQIVGELDETVLAIQGPPGSGKTYCGAQMICELVRQGNRVGVTATSHKVIRNLLDAVAKEDATVRVAHKNENDADDGGTSEIKALKSNDAARDALQSGEANVVGGTAWLWAREDFASSVDVLFVDEAGQMALANVVAVSQAANSVVLLGDPQQLEQPRKGSHPDGVDASALQHILGAHQTIPEDCGIFLAETWRLAPSICAFTSELFYDGRLTSREGLERQRIVGARGLPGSGLALIDVDHEGNRNFSTEEIEVVADLMTSLTSGSANWIDADGKETRLIGSDVLVVSPYNAQVSRLTERLAGTGARVGTVDKFQGQEAPVVIYSMASSSPEDAPRGMEFLYSLNRLNVATSRARCLVIVVANPRLYEAECHSPRQMRLANGLCLYREMASIHPWGAALTML